MIAVDADGTIAADGAGMTAVDADGGGDNHSMNMQSPYEKKR